MLDHLTLATGETGPACGNAATLAVAELFLSCSGNGKALPRLLAGEKVDKSEINLALIHCYSCNKDVIGDLPRRTREKPRCLGQVLLSSATTPTVSKTEDDDVKAARFSGKKQAIYLEAEGRRILFTGVPVAGIAAIDPGKNIRNLNIATSALSLARILAFAAALDAKPESPVILTEWSTKNNAMARNLRRTVHRSAVYFGSYRGDEDTVIDARLVAKAIVDLKSNPKFTPTPKHNDANDPVQHLAGLLVWINETLVAAGLPAVDLSLRSSLSWSDDEWIAAMNLLQAEQKKFDGGPKETEAEQPEGAGE